LIPCRFLPVTKPPFLDWDSYSALFPLIGSFFSSSGPFFFPPPLSFSFLNLLSSSPFFKAPRGDVHLPVASDHATLSLVVLVPPPPFWCSFLQSLSLLQSAPLNFQWPSTSLTILSSFQLGHPPLFKIFFGGPFQALFPFFFRVATFFSARASSLPDAGHGRDFTMLGPFFLQVSYPF